MEEDKISIPITEYEDLIRKALVYDCIMQSPNVPEGEKETLRMMFGIATTVMEE